MEVGVLAGQDLGLLPDQASLALQGLEVPLDELGGAVLLDESESVDAEAILVPISMLFCFCERRRLTI